VAFWATVVVVAVLEPGRGGDRSPGRSQEADELQGDGRGDGREGLLVEPERRDARGYAAILRDVTTKGKEARFQKVERGQFVLPSGTFSAACPTLAQADVDA
jgi:hypothetical protein